MYVDAGMRWLDTSEQTDVPLVEYVDTFRKSLT